MKKEIVTIDQEKGIYRVTTIDERWYSQESKDPETGLPSFIFRPSVTWISGSYPKGIAFYKWLGGKGWDEAEAIKVAAGDKGSKVHQAIEYMIGGNTLKMDDKLFMNHSTEKLEDLNFEEYEAVCSFVQWANENKVEFILNEQTVISEKYNYAGTVDCVCKIGEQIYIVDFKTGQYIWPEGEIQISAYKQALGEAGRKVENVKLAILQIGYKRNKKLFKFTEIEDQFDLFLHARAIWEKEHSKERPRQIDYPLELKLDKIEPEPKKPIINKPKKNAKKGISAVGKPQEKNR